MSLSNKPQSLSSRFKKLASVLGGKEKLSRSFYKTATWRATAAADTAALSYFFTHDVAAAGAIVGAEFITKPAIYLVHERLWAPVKWGKIPKQPEAANQNSEPLEPEASLPAPTEYKDTKLRSGVKGITYRLLGSADTFLLGLVFTQNSTAAGAIAVTELATKIGLYYGHERVWDNGPKQLWNRMKTLFSRSGSNDNKKSAPPLSPQNESVSAPPQTVHTPEV